MAIISIYSILFNRLSTTVHSASLMITGGGGVFTARASHSLTCTASGGASMTYTYQWLKYDEDIVGET